MNWQEYVLSDEVIGDLKKKWENIEKLYPEANFLQSPAWGKVNQLVGHKVIVVEFGTGGADATGSRLDDASLKELQSREQRTGWCLMIIKDAKRGRYLEIPGGPLMDWTDESSSATVFQKIKELAEREKCVFIRLRPQLRMSEENLARLQKLGMQKAPMHLHAEHTVILDLTKSEDELLADMRRQTRYEVRRSGKLGMTVDYSNSEEIFQEFHQIQLQTAERQHFVPPDLKMLMAERTAFGENARLYVAKTADGDVVAYGLILISGAEAEYFEAASTEANQKMPGAYALLWQAMKDLKADGIKRFNLWGIAPPGQTEHRYAGVTIFKKGFGGEVVEFVPAQDIVINGTRYLLNKAVEGVRKKVRHL